MCNSKKSCFFCNKPIKLANKFCDKICYNNYVKSKRIENLENGLLKDNDTIRLALIEKYGDVCSICNINSVWNNLPLILQVDHIDGNSDNNVESNLRLLCPNCHTQTDTFCGGGKPKATKRNKYLQSYKQTRSFNSVV